MISLLLTAQQKWVQHFIWSYLPQLKDQWILAEAFAQSLNEELQERKLMAPAQQKNYKSNMAQAIKLIDPLHAEIDQLRPFCDRIFAG